MVAAAAETDLFGTPVERPAQAKRARSTNDMRAVQAVLARACSGCGYALAGVAERVCRIVDPDRLVIERVPDDEALVVEQLIRGRWLTVGGQHRYTWRNRREGTGRSVLVPRSTQNTMQRWAHLRGEPITKTNHTEGQRQW